MSRFKSPDVEENVGCNLIPMIDIMFLLLLFFMLGADMSQREFEDVVLPQADMVQEDEKEKGAEGLTTISLHHREKSGGFSCPVYDHNGLCRDETHWLMTIRGKAYTQDTIKDQLIGEARLELEDPTGKGKNKLSKRKVIIRADQMAPYGSVQRVIETCGLAGLYKIEIGAAMPPKS